LKETFLTVYIRGFRKFNNQGCNLWIN